MTERMAHIRKGKGRARSATILRTQFIDENYKLLDDVHDNINTMIRQKIRPINMAPESWWTKGSLRQVERNT